ncbi:MAG TPA: MFS transporter [Anaerolineaceae bacterium]|nr:MFS transporter [Anaerolineaceae bacterium]
MTGFTLVWAGQIISVLASNMTQFALTIWAFQETGSAVILGTIQTVFIIPFIILSPIAGVMVDRYNRKAMMMISDLFSITSTFGILLLQMTGNLEIWHLYVAAAINGIGNTFQWPAYSAAISTMIPKEQYSRANGMMGLIDSGPSVVSPILAGALLPFIGLTGILTIDVVTFLFAVSALLLVFIPTPAQSEAGKAGEGSLWHQVTFGFKYIYNRKPLLGLLSFFLSLNFFMGMAFPVLAPFILLRTSNNSTALGAIESATAIGAVVGGLLLSIWGGFKRRTYSIFLGEFMTALFCIVLFGFGRDIPAWILFSVLGALFFPFTFGASQAIWQAKVPPDVQGRVFTARRMIAWLLDPITPVLAGVLADYVTEPFMKSGAPLAQFLGTFVGNSPGSGIAVQFIVAGSIYMLIVIGVFCFVPMIRNLEDRLPDHDQIKPSGSPSAQAAS